MWGGKAADFGPGRAGEYIGSAYGAHRGYPEGEMGDEPMEAEAASAGF